MYSFKSVRDFSTPRVRSVPSRVTDKVMFSVNKGTTGAKHIASVVLGEQVMAGVNLAVGDIVEVMVDTDKGVLLLRKADEGYRLSPVDPKCSVKTAAGQVKRSVVAFTVNDGMGIRSEKHGRVEVDFEATDNSILVQLPDSVLLNAEPIQEAA